MWELTVLSNDIWPQEPSTPDTGNQQPSTTQSSRTECFYAPEKRVQLFAELLGLTTQAFAKSLSRETWKGLIENYPKLEGTESFLAAPIMEAGMKEDIKKKHGYNKTKDVFNSFDDGLAKSKQLSYLLPVLSWPP